MNTTLRIAGACLNQTPFDWKNNLQNIHSAILEAQKHHCKILCLPELCITGYGCEDLFLSRWLEKTSLEKLFEIVPWCKNITVCVGLPLRYNEQLYNSTCLIENQRIIGFYAKQRLANDGVHYESRWFTPWQTEKKAFIELNGESYPIGHYTFKSNGINIGFEICEDAWQDDRPISYVQEEVDLVLNPSASHFAFNKAKFREKIVLDSSKKFNCTYLYTNLLGNEAGRMIYDGDILVAKNGELLGRNNRLQFGSHKILYIDLEPEKQHQQKNVNPDFNHQNEEFANAAALALYDYLRKSRSKGFVLSLSGGADSSCIATLVSLSINKALKQLGVDEVKKQLGIDFPNDQKQIVKSLLITAYQASVNSSKETFKSAKGLANSLGAKFYHWTIDHQVAGATSIIENVLDRKLNWEYDDIALQNIQARSRAPIIWMLANINNSLLLATSNRSEGDVGYATMDGDTSGSISPIAGVSKQFVLQWLKYAEKELGYTGLSFVNELTPTAELRPENQHQTDEEDLMPYEVLKDLEREAILYGKSPLMIIDSLSNKYKIELLRIWIKKFFQLWSRNQWKRERYAPSFHFDDFNIDPRSWYRFPILNGGYREELDAI